MTPKPRWSLSLCALGLLVACSRQPAAIEAQPDPRTQPAPLTAEERAREESDRKLAQSLARLEQLRREADAPDASATAAAAKPQAAPLPEAAPLAATKSLDAGTRAGPDWAEVTRLVQTDHLTDALRVARDRWPTGGAAVPPEGVVALRNIEGLSQRHMNQKWDEACPDQVEALDALPETDANGRPILAALWAELANRAALENEVPLARKLGRRALQLEEVQPLAFSALARAAYSECDFDEAEKYWERAARGSSDPASIRSYRGALDALAKERASLPSGRKASEHFTVLYDPREDEEAARLTLEFLGEAREAVGATHGSLPPHVVTVVLYAGQSFEKIRHVSWGAAHYDGRVRIGSGGAAAASLRFKEVLFHEYAHGVFDQVTQDGRHTAPGWLNEGLACVAGYRVAPFPLGGCRMGHGFPLRKLEVPFATLDVGRARPAYLEAQHAAERLRESFGAQKVHELLREMAKRKNFEDAFEHTFGVSYPKWAETFDAETGH